MTIRCAAVFENGILRPKAPLALPEGAEVDVAVEYSKGAEQRTEIVQALTAIARLPMEANDHGFSGADHDKVLYGVPGSQ